MKQKNRSLFNILTTLTFCLALTLSMIITSPLIANAEEAETYTSSGYYIQAQYHDTTFGQKYYVDYTFDYTNSFSNHNYCIYKTSCDGYDLYTPMYGRLWGTDNEFIAYGDSFKSIGTEVFFYMARYSGDSIENEWTTLNGMSFTVPIHSDQGDYIKTNIPTFESKESAENYILNGDTSGQIDGLQEIVNVDDFTLINFQCDSSIYASWEDINCPDYIDKANVTVCVKPTYFVILEYGEELQDFDGLGTLAVHGQNYFSCPYDDYFADNPYKGRCMLILSFIPTYTDAETHTTYDGKPVTVTIDKDGNIENVDLPEGSLVAEHNTDFYLNNFTSTNEFHNWGDCYIHCYWNGATIPSGVSYVYSDIKVQLYARTGSNEDCSYDWIDYVMDDIVSINSNRLDFNLTILDDYCREQGYRFYDTVHQWKNEKIRITPYYKTSTEYVYGRSVEITLTPLGGIESIMQSQGDALTDSTVQYDDLEEDYFTDHSVIGDMYDDITNTDGTDLDINSIATNFFTGLSSFFKACGQFPSLVATVFFFLPSYYAQMLTIALSVIIIMRILGR